MRGLSRLELEQKVNNYNSSYNNKNNINNNNNNIRENWYSTKPKALG